MRKASGFLLSVFVFNILAFFPAFIFNQYTFKEEMKERIRESISNREIVEICVNEDEHDIHWLDENEFRYKGSLYDVVRTTTDENGTLHLFCINDSKEEELFTHLENHLRNHISDSPSQQQHAKTILKILLQDYFFEDLSSCCPVSASAGFPHSSLGFITAPFICFSSPPPEV